MIDIIQTTGSLLRHPTHEITRIIIGLSTVKASEAVPGIIQLLTPGHHRQVKIPMGGAIFDATSCVIDSAPFWGPEALDTIQPRSGSSTVIPTADQASALRPPPSHTKSLMFRNSGRPYPPIQLPAQRWEGEPSAFTPPHGEGFASTSGRHQSNEMNSGFENSNQLALYRKSFPLNASADSGIDQQTTAGDPSSMIGFVENTCPVAAPRAASHSVIASSHWRTTTASNGELPCHISSLSRSDQCGSSTITFPSTQTVFSRSHLPWQSSAATPLRDAVEHADYQPVPHIQQSLFFHQHWQTEPVPIGKADLSFYTPSSESATDHSYYPMSRIAHASTTALHRRSNASAR